jgi:hypothetical protein
MRFCPVCHVAALLMAAFALSTPAVAGAAVDRVQVGVPGQGSLTRGFSEGLALSLTSPAAYERGCCSDFVTGVWLGPRVQSSGGAVEQNRARIDWSVTFARTRRSAASLARAAAWGQYGELSGRPARVRHIVGGRNVGTLKAFSVVTAEAAPGARAQGAIAVSLGRRVYATALFDAGDPYADETSDGRLTVQGMAGSAWNRAQAAASVGGVRIEGSLPPAKVVARPAGRGLRGRVTDGFGHPVAEIALVTQRRVAGAWRRVGRGVATRRGTFELNARRAGSYRVIATLAGSSARSPAVRAGR